MSRLPDRPDTDQLRRQARELHRAAANGDTRALERLRQVSGKVTLSAAQLAIARDYGVTKITVWNAVTGRTYRHIDRGRA